MWPHGDHAAHITMRDNERPVETYLNRRNQCARFCLLLQLDLPRDDKIPHGDLLGESREVFHCPNNALILGRRGGGEGDPFFILQLARFQSCPLYVTHASLILPLAKTTTRFTTGKNRFGLYWWLRRSLNSFLISSPEGGAVGRNSRHAQEVLHRHASQ